MAKYLVETYYNCTFKVSHYLDEISDSELKSLEKRDDGKFEILDVKLDNRKTKNLDKIGKVSKIANKDNNKLDLTSKIKSNHKNIAQVIGDDHIIDIASLGKLSETSLTRDSKILIEKSGLPNTFVPGRNLLFLTMASALGWRRNIFNLVGGMCQTDYSGYPDCRKDTINAQEKTLSLGLDKKVKIYTPLMYLNKKEIWQLAKEIGGDDFIELIINNTHSCYLGDRSKLNRWGFGCGSCPSCILRSKGYDDWIEK